MVAKPLCPLYKNIIKPLDRARYPELRYMCSIVPLSMDDLSVLLHRNSKSFKNKNIKVLLENNQLFYWIPEMTNHPLQKYVAASSMARSNSRKSC